MSKDSGSEEGEADRVASELEEGMHHLGRTMGGLATRLLGSKVTGIEIDPEKPVISKEADQAIDELGSTAGRWLDAAGKGLRAHPSSPSAALDEMMSQREVEVDPPEGVAPLTAGLRSLAGGLYKSTEAVLDKVAPRKSASQDDEVEESDEEASEL